MKILGLSPALMLDNTREINTRSLSANFDLLKLDGWAIYDQCFQDSDFDPRFTYVGHADKRMGWAVPRNGLLKYFYESDYDYCFWIDANSTLSKTTWNDVRTIIEALREGKLDKCDTIFGTLGMWVSQERKDVKQLPDFFDNVHIVPVKMGASYNWMHGLIHKNFKKYYGQEFYMDEKCHVLEGTPEDVFFARTLKKYTNAYLAPTVVVNKPTSKQSCTMANEKGSYDYPPVLFDVEDKMIEENAQKYGWKHVKPNQVRDDITLPRLAEYKDFIKPYVSRAKKPAPDNKVELF